MEEDWKWSVQHSAMIHRFSAPTAEVTARLALTPTRAANADDPAPLPHRPDRTARISYWILELPEETFDTDGMNSRGLRGVDDLIELFLARRDAVLEFCPPGELSFKSIVHSDSPNIIAFVDAARAARLAELAAAWAVSTWHIGPGGVADWFGVE